MRNIFKKFGREGKNPGGVVSTPLGRFRLAKYLGHPRVKKVSKKFQKSFKESLKKFLQSFEKLKKKVFKKVSKSFKNVFKKISKKLKFFFQKLLLLLPNCEDPHSMRL